MDFDEHLERARGEREAVTPPSPEPPPPSPLTRVEAREARPALSELEKALDALWESTRPISGVLWAWPDGDRQWWLSTAEIVFTDGTRRAYEFERLRWMDVEHAIGWCTRRTMERWRTPGAVAEYWYADAVSTGPPPAGRAGWKRVGIEWVPSWSVLPKRARRWWSPPSPFGDQLTCITCDSFTVEIVGGPRLLAQVEARSSASESREWRLELVGALKPSGGPYGVPVPRSTVGDEIWTVERLVQLGGCDLQSTMSDDQSSIHLRSSVTVEECFDRWLGQIAAGIA